ncbi:MAG TPA: SRPBCC family protein [Chloroflexota bacterium]|nr:SRPBCC family protein [Chloroflexota bacterium]
MPVLEEKVVIAAPARSVFDRLADVERSPDWAPNLTEVRRTSKARTGRGLRLALVAREAGRESKGTGRCLEWEPPRRLVLEFSFDIGATTTTAFELTQNGSKTELKARADYSLPKKGFGGMAISLLAGTMARRGLRKSLENLKSQLEADASVSA